MTTRERILHAVLRVIGTDGVAGVTNRRVAREAEVSLGSITYHFATQHELLREAMLLFVTAETEHGQPARGRSQQCLGVGLLAEVEMRREGVLEEVHTEVAEEDEQIGVGDVGRLRQHPHERGGQHEPGPTRHEVAQGGVAVLVGGGHDDRTGHVGGCRYGGKGQVC